MTGRAILRLSPIALLVLLTACGGGGTAMPRVSARVYLLHNGKVAPVARTVRSLKPSDLYEALLRGATATEIAIGLTSAIPKGSHPIPIRTNRLELAQYTYTLSQADPTTSVTIDGKRYTRADFEEQTPAILLENPLPFALVTSPIHAAGTANTFEATFQYELKDAAGKILAKHFVTATSGNGVRGTFDASIPFTVAQQESATLTVYEDSAATGKRINEYAIPLTLSP
jgi:hypothetical protein